MDRNLRKTLEALESGARELGKASKQAAEKVLDRLENQKRADDGDPEAIHGELDRKAKDIAEDLKRVDRLMKERREGD